MNFKKGFGLASILAILAIVAAAPHLTPASAPKIVEKRQIFSPIDPVLFSILEVEVGLLILALKLIDIQARKVFTVQYIKKLAANIPGKNIVICNVAYTLSCTPEFARTVYYHAIIGKKVSYDVLVFGKGCTFDRKGDGGYQNWAYIAPTGCQIDGGHIAC